MKKEVAGKLFSYLFLSVFFIKVVISIAPLVLSHFDSRSVNASIMQLEIENNANPGDVKELNAKELFTPSNFRFKLIRPLLLVGSCKISVDHDKHIQAFYPPVATPPPNV